MFDDLPNEIKTMIFARVRHMDLYEVSCVSKEWWTLTMATCRPTSEKYYHFLKFQVDFCNKMMSKEGGWKYWMFVEFTDEKSIQFHGPQDEELVEYLLRKGIRVRKLIYRGDPSILPNLKDLFPHLQAIDFAPNFSEYDGKAVELPDGLERLRLTIYRIHPSSHLKDAFEHLERVDSIHISCYKRILFDNITFDRLKKLHLYMAEQSPDDIKSLVTGSKQLSIVYLEHGMIDKQWLGLFPKNIKDIHLENMRLDETVMSLFESANAFVARQLMRFLCQDWTKIRKFKSSNLFHRNNGEYIYVCRPQMLEEELDLTIYDGETPSGILDKGKLQLKALQFIDDRRTKCEFGIIVPKSVKHFELEARKFEVINFAVLFKDISTIEKLRINSFGDTKIQFSDFPHAVNLVALNISLIDDVILASILSNCPSLKQLLLDCPQGFPFSKLSSDLKSTSVKQLAIIQPKDSIGNILGHFPNLVDLHLKHVNMETVKTADLAQLTSLEFVRIIFNNVNDLNALNLVVNCLDQLSFSDDDSHLILGYSPKKPYDGKEILSCVMGREKAFYRRYLSLNSENDFIQMNIEDLSDCFTFGTHLYLKSVSSTHLKLTRPEWYKITYDLKEFLANTSTEMLNTS